MELVRSDPDRKAVGKLGAEKKTFFLSLHANHVRNVLDDARQLNGMRPQLQLVGLNLREVEHIVYEREEMPSGADNSASPRVGFGWGLLRAVGSAHSQV